MHAQAALRRQNGTCTTDGKDQKQAFAQVSQAFDKTLTRHVAYVISAAIYQCLYKTDEI